MTAGPRHHQDQMVSRIAPSAATRAAQAVTSPKRRPGFQILITAADGSELLRMYEDERGLLHVEGDEERWSEAAKRFLHNMMQWSGQVGIRWKDEAVKAGQQ